VRLENDSGNNNENSIGMKDMKLWMLAAVTAPKASPVLSSPSVYLLNGTKAKKSARGLVIEDGRKQINQ